MWRLILFLICLAVLAWRTWPKLTLLLGAVVAVLWVGYIVYAFGAVLLAPRRGK